MDAIISLAAAVVFTVAGLATGNMWLTAIGFGNLVRAWIVRGKSSK